MSGEGPLDSRGMWAATAALPEQLTSALATAAEVWPDVAAPRRPPEDAVVLLGVGQDALAGDAVAALAAGRSAVPVLVAPPSELPAFVGPRTLVVALSSSGLDADTVAATEAALARGTRTAVVAANGPLSSLAVEAGVPWCPVGDGGVPRAAMGAVVVSVLVALSRHGVLPDPAPSVLSAASSLRRRGDAYAAPGGPAAEVARRIGRTIPVVYGASGVGAVAARRWKAQVNLNAKSPAFDAPLPALTRDELAGWGQGGDITRQVMSLVFLRHAGEDPAVAELFDAVAAAMDEVMADIVEVRAEGDDDIGRFFDLVLCGDFVSLFLAAREGVDPGPVPVIEELGAGPA